MRTSSTSLTVDRKMLKRGNIPNFMNMQGNLWVNACALIYMFMIGPNESKRMEMLLDDRSERWEQKLLDDCRVMNQIHALEELELCDQLEYPLVSRTIPYRSSRFIPQTVHYFFHDVVTQRARYN